MSERFYVNCVLRPGPVEVEGPEAHHLATVCRLRRGDAVCLFNGDGQEYHAEVTAVDRKRVVLEVRSAESPPRELPFFLELAVPLPKGDRAQFLVEKLTELGVNRLVPLRTSRSVVVPGEGKREKMERWVIEASKQCGRNRLMEIAPPADWASYAGRADLPKHRWLAHPTGRKLATEIGAGPTAMAVGPEGGFTDEEIALGVNNCWELIALGPRILRVETAAISLAGWASIANFAAT
jgi:16S rRNA (uracil1498-N3)-methyltransferase